MSLLNPPLGQRYLLNEVTIDQIEQEVLQGDLRRFERCLKFFSSTGNYEFYKQSKNTCYKFVRLFELTETSQATVTKIMKIFVSHNVFKQCAEENLQITCNDGIVVPFDRQILMASSQFFKNLLKGNFGKKGEGTLDFSTCSSVCMLAFKRYLYEGKNPELKTATEFKEFLTLAAMIENKDLITKFLNELKEAIPKVQTEEDFAKYMHCLSSDNIEPDEKIALQCQLIEAFFKHNKVLFLRMDNQFLIGIDYLYLINQDNELSNFIQYFVNGIILKGDMLTFNMLGFIQPKVADSINEAYLKDRISSTMVDELADAFKNLSVIHQEIGDADIYNERLYSPIIEQRIFDELLLDMQKFKTIKTFTLHSSRKALCIDVKQDLKEPLDLTIDCQFTLGLVFSKHEPKFMMRLFEREESTWIDDVTSNWQRKTLQIKGHR